MNNNKISNQKTEVPSTPEMNDKDYITSMLEIEKAMVKNYAVALTEASNEDLYNDYYDLFDEASNAQRDIYNLMFQKGWYSIETAEDTKITQKLNMLEQELPQLDNNN